MSKSIAQLDAVATRPLEEAERYYLDVHVPLLQRLYADLTDHVERYAPQRVLGRLDPSGGFGRKADVWRFIVHHYRDEFSVGMSEQWRDVASRDHEHFLENLRVFHVDGEDVVVDRLRGQTSTSKYLLRIGGPRVAAVDTVMEALVEQFARAPQARRLVINTVTTERVVAALDRPGQLVTPEIAPSDVGCIVELYFDNQRAGAAFFSDDRVRLPLLLDLGADKVSGYVVDELTAYDAR